MEAFDIENVYKFIDNEEIDKLIKYIKKYFMYNGKYYFFDVKNKQIKKITLYRAQVLIFNNLQDGTYDYYFNFNRLIGCMGRFIRINTMKNDILNIKKKMIQCEDPLKLISNLNFAENPVLYREALFFYKEPQFNNYKVIN